jgi:GxxExxY protein
MKTFEPIPAETERIAQIAVDSAYKVHDALAPGLLESVYEACLCHELSKRAIPFKKQVSLPVTYDGVRLDAGLRLDLLLADALIIELKSAEKILPLHEAQLLTYLKLTGLRLGLLVNFNVPVIKEGIRRIVL